MQYLFSDRHLVETGPIGNLAQKRPKRNVACCLFFFSVCSFKFNQNGHNIGGFVVYAHRRRNICLPYLNMKKKVARGAARC